MSKICPKCKQPVDDGLYFCNNCNYAFDANTRLVMELEQWEKEYYRRNRSRIELRKKYSAADLEEQQRLQKLLQ